MGIKNDFGLRLKELRLKKGVTQTRLAEMSGIDPKHMSHIETGRSFPKADLIEKFAAVLDIDYLELFKIKRIKDRDDILKEINEMLKNSDDKDLNVVYKLILSYFCQD